MKRAEHINMVAKPLHRSVDLVNSVGKSLVNKQLIKVGLMHKSIQNTCNIFSVSRQNPEKQPPDKILLCISGGQDSICLLVILNQLCAQMEFKLGLVWCHHLWQIDSFSLMRQITKISYLFQLNSCFAITPKSIPSELLARNWRHECSARICFFYNYYKMSLAHSASDKTETILLNFMRGTGVAGLSPLSWEKKMTVQDMKQREHVSQLLRFANFQVFFFIWSPFFFCQNKKKSTYQLIVPTFSHVTHAHTTMHHVRRTRHNAPSPTMPLGTLAVHRRSKKMHVVKRLCTMHDAPWVQRRFTTCTCTRGASARASCKDVSLLAPKEGLMRCRASRLKKAVPNCNMKDAHQLMQKKMSKPNNLLSLNSKKWFYSVSHTFLKTCSISFEQIAQRSINSRNICPRLASEIHLPCTQDTMHHAHTYGKAKRSIESASSKVQVPVGTPRFTTSDVSLLAPAVMHLLSNRIFDCRASRVHRSETSEEMHVHRSETSEVVKRLGARLCISDAEQVHAGLDNIENVTRVSGLYIKDVKKEKACNENCKLYLEKNPSTIRPLLALNRFDISKLCIYWELPVYPDQSNQKMSFLRNRIRKQLLPTIKLFFNSRIENILLQFSEIFSDENHYMNQITNKLFNKLGPANTLAHSPFFTCSYNPAINPLSFEYKRGALAVHRRSETSLHDARALAPLVHVQVVKRLCTQGASCTKMHDRRRKGASCKIKDFFVPIGNQISPVAHVTPEVLKANFTPFHMHSRSGHLHDARALAPLVHVQVVKRLCTQGASCKCKESTPPQLQMQTSQFVLRGTASNCEAICGNVINQEKKKQQITSNYFISYLYSKGVADQLLIHVVEHDQLTSNLLWTEIQLNGHYLTPSSTPSGSLLFKRLYKILYPIKTIPRYSVPIGATFWVWNRKLYRAKKFTKSSTSYHPEPGSNSLFSFYQRCLTENFAKKKSTHILARCTCIRDKDIQDAEQVHHVSLPSTVRSNVRHAHETRYNLEQNQTYKKQINCSAHMKDVSDKLLTPCFHILNVYTKQKNVLLSTLKKPFNWHKNPASISKRKVIITSLASSMSARRADAMVHSLAEYCLMRTCSQLFFVRCTVHDSRCTMHDARCTFGAKVQRCKGAKVQRRFTTCTCTRGASSETSEVSASRVHRSETLEVQNFLRFDCTHVHCKRQRLLLLTKCNSIRNHGTSCLVSDPINVYFIFSNSFGEWKNVNEALTLPSQLELSARIAIGRFFTPSVMDQRWKSCFLRGSTWQTDKLSILNPHVALKSETAEQKKNTNKLVNVFSKFDKLEKDKKEIYWPLIISFLPKAIQRRFVKLFLVNQNLKQVRYSHIEQFLSIIKKF